MEPIDKTPAYFFRERKRLQPDQLISPSKKLSSLLHSTILSFKNFNTPTELEKLLTHVHEEELYYIIPHLSSLQIEMVLTFINPGLLRACCLAIPQTYRDALLKDWNEPDDGSLISDTSLFELAILLTTKDALDKFHFAWEEFTFRQLLLSTKLVNLSELHDVYDSLAHSQIIPLVPYLTPEEIGGIASILSSKTLKLIVSHLTLPQFTALIPCILDAHLILGFLTYLNNEQFKALVSELPNEIKQAIVSKLHFYDDFTMTNNDIHKSNPDQLAVALTYRPVAPLLLKQINNFSQIQLRRAAVILTSDQVIEAFTYLEEKGSQLLSDALLLEQKKPFLEKSRSVLSEVEKELPQIIKFFESYPIELATLLIKIKASATDELIKTIGEDIFQRKRALTVSIQRTGNFKESLFPHLLFNEGYDLKLHFEINLAYEKVKVIRDKMKSYIQALNFNFSQEIEKAKQRINFKTITPITENLCAAHYAKGTRSLIKEYEMIQVSCARLNISSKDLDDANISWDDLYTAQLITPENFAKRKITNLADLKKYIS